MSWLNQPYQGGYAGQPNQQQQQQMQQQQQQQQQQLRAQPTGFVQVSSSVEISFEMDVTDEC
jgi:hypothetical protein